MTGLECLSALYNATRRVGLTDDLKELLETVLEQAQELIGFDHCALMLYEADTGRLRVQSVRGYGERADEVLRLTLPRGRGLSGWAAEHRRSVRVGDVTRDARYVAGLRECRSNLAVPLLVENQVAGVINVESERLDAFTEVHEELLTVLGSQAALAILAARTRERLQQRIEQLNALYRISQLASGQDDVDPTLDAILAVTEGVIPDGNVAVLLIDGQSRSLIVRAERGYAEGVRHLRIPLGEGITGRCAESGDVIVVDDLHQHGDYIPGVEGARSEVALPLKVEGRVIGVLNAESLTPNAYSEDHVRTLSVVAQQAAVVIRAAQLNEETRHLAVTDPLTGLYNRRYFVERLEEQLRRAHRYGGRAAVIMIDCDHLKTINDRHGHLAGDRALLAVADVMRIMLRDTDVLARLGGDEFAALLLEAEPDSARGITHRLREHVAALSLVAEDGGEIRLSVSTGIAFYPEDGTDVKGLLRGADRGLYRLKRDRRSSVHPPDAGVALEGGDAAVSGDEAPERDPAL